MAYPRRVVVRYVLLQIPGILLTGLLLTTLAWKFDLSFWIVPIGMLAWAAKDVALFPLVWKAYDPDPSMPQMVGLHGTADSRIAPEGFARVRGELWQARVEADTLIERGEPLEVVAQNRMQLVVRRLED